MITLQLSDLLLIAAFGILLLFGVGWLLALARKVERNTRILSKLDGEIIPPDDLVRSIQRLSTQVQHLSYDRINQSGPDTLKSYDLIGRITHLLLFERIYNLDELKTMAEAFQPRLNGSIDYSTESSAARGIVDTMIRQGRWAEMVAYIQDTRSEWDLYGG